MSWKTIAERRKRLANNPGVHPEVRWFIKQLNGVEAIWGTTTTTTSTTTTTTTTT